MARQGATDFRFDLTRLPWLPGAVEYGRAGAFPGGMDNNANFFGPSVTFADEITYLYRDLLFTPETSGGLLVAVPPVSYTHLDVYKRQLAQRGVGRGARRCAAGRGI